MNSNGVLTDDDVMLVSSGLDQTLHIWNASTGLGETFHLNDSSINCLAIHPFNRMCAAGSSQSIQIFDLSSHPNIEVVSEDMVKPVLCIGFSVDGNWIYGGGEDCHAKVWRISYKSDSLSPEVDSQDHPVDCVGSGCHCVSKLKLVNKLDVGCTVNAMVLHPNQVEMFVGDRRGVVIQWNLTNRQLIRHVPSKSLDMFHAIRHIDINAEATMCLASNSSGMCFYWQMVQQRKDDDDGTVSSLLNLRHSIQIHDTYALCCRFSPDSTMFATTSADETATIWRTADFEMISLLKDPEQSWVWDCAFTKDSEYLITASSDVLIRVWHIATGAIKRIFCGHRTGVTCFAFRDAEDRSTTKTTTTTSNEL